MPFSHIPVQAVGAAHSPEENGSRAQEQLNTDVDISSSTTSLANVNSN